MVMDLHVLRAAGNFLAIICIRALLHGVEFVTDFLYLGNWCCYGKDSSNKNTGHLRTVFFLAIFEDQPPP
jgi:hypothetical protein